MKGKTVVQRREGRNCQGVADTQRRPRGRQARGRAAAGFLAGSQASDFFAVLADSPLAAKPAISRRALLT